MWSLLCEGTSSPSGNVTAVRPSSSLVKATVPKLALVMPEPNVQHFMELKATVRSAKSADKNDMMKSFFRLAQGDHTELKRLKRHHCEEVTEGSEGEGLEAGDKGPSGSKTAKFFSMACFAP